MKKSYFPILINLHSEKTGEGIYMFKTPESIPSGKKFAVLKTKATRRDLLLARKTAKEIMNCI